MKFVPYLCCGDPNAEFTVKAALALAPYSRLIELGIPFSDPIADGPAIQEASQRALAKGGGVRQALEIAKKISSSVSAPLAFMTYYNPVFAFGKEKFLQEAKKAGVSALIIPDLPFGEEPEFERMAKEKGIGIVGLVSPSTPEKRAEKIIAASSPFAYLVSVSGTTGERKEVGKESIGFVKRMRKIGGKEKELFVGFGVSSSFQAREFVDAGATGVIVGSKLAKLYSRHIKDGQIKEEAALQELEGFGKGIAEA